MILLSGRQDLSRSRDIMDMEMEDTSATMLNVPPEIHFTKSIDMALVLTVICMTLSRSNSLYAVSHFVEGFSDIVNKAFAYKNLLSNRKYFARIFRLDNIECSL